MPKKTKCYHCRRLATRSIRTVPMCYRCHRIAVEHSADVTDDLLGVLKMIDQRKYRTAVESLGGKTQ